MVDLWSIRFKYTLRLASDPLSFGGPAFEAPSRNQARAAGPRPSRRISEVCRFLGLACATGSPGSRRSDGWMPGTLRGHQPARQRPQRFLGFTLCPCLAGESSEARCWRCRPSVCWQCSTRHVLRRVFPTLLKKTGCGTEITYVAHISHVEMFYDYENKSDRLRAGFDRQAGGARRFAGSAGREDPGNGHRP